MGKSPVDSRGSGLPCRGQICPLGCPRARSCDDAGSAARQSFAGFVQRLDPARARPYASGSYGFLGTVLRIMNGPNRMRMDAYASAAAVEWVFLRIALLPQEAQSFAIVVEAGCG